MFLQTKKYDCEKFAYLEKSLVFKKFVDCEMLGICSYLYCNKIKKVNIYLYNVTKMIDIP